MKNPCEICLVKVNCTQVCPAKINFKTLLENALKYYKVNGMVFFKSINDRKYYRKYLQLLLKTESEMSKIKSRKLGIENPCKDFLFKQEYHVKFNDI